MVTATNSVVDAINQVASNARVRLAMLMGAKLESGWNAGAVGDNGHSFGPFQINIPAHPNVSPQSAQDPTWATRFMLPAYEAGVNRVDPAMWNADPALAAATAAFYAERPKVMYPIDRVRGSWSQVNTAWSGGAGAIGSGLGLGADSPTGDAQGIRNPVDVVGQGVSDLANWTYWKAFDAFGGLVDKVFFGVLIGGGALTVFVGFYLLMRSSRTVAIVQQTGSAFASVLRPVRSMGGNNGTSSGSADE